MATSSSLTRSLFGPSSTAFQFHEYSEPHKVKPAQLHWVFVLANFHLYKCQSKPDSTCDIWTLLQARFYGTVFIAHILLLYEQQMRMSRWNQGFFSNFLGMPLKVCVVWSISYILPLRIEAPWGIASCLQRSLLCPQPTVSTGSSTESTSNTNISQLRWGHLPHLPC